MSRLILSSRQQEFNLAFDFQSFPHKLIIKVQAEDATYQEEIPARPGLDFNHLHESLLLKEFIVVLKRADILKLTVAGLDLDFQNFDKIMIAELQGKLAESKKEILRLNGQVDIKYGQIENMATDYAQLRQTLIESEENNHAEIARLNQIIASKDQIIQQAMAKLSDQNQVQPQCEKTKQQKTPEDIDEIIPSTIAFHQIYSHSKIVTEKIENQNLSKFFNKLIKEVKLLYRASENDFSTEKFHEKCDNIPNTLILCQTEFGNKIGGFTPLTWEKTQKLESKGDESEESFIFSLTYRDKFILKNKNQAIGNHKDQGPAFGGDQNYLLDFWIGDQSNLKYTSGAWLSISYQNVRYSRNDKNSRQRFSGHPNGSGTFLVKDWEVWKLEWA